MRRRSDAVGRERLKESKRAELRQIDMRILVSVDDGRYGTGRQAQIDEQTWKRIFYCSGEHRHSSKSLHEYPSLLNARVLNVSRSLITHQLHGRPRLI